jgi:photosystem II stability/assembly factor-like uncharacterized protein
MANDGTTVRARAGDCLGESKTGVQVSAAPAAASPDATLEAASMLDVEAGSAGEVVVVAANANCNVRSYTSTDLGKTWTSGEPDGAWYADPEDEDIVQSPDGARRPGCEVTEVHAIDNQVVRVTCADGLILGTADGGERWVTLGKLEGAHAMVFTAPSNAVALAPVAGCGAQALLTRDGGRTWDAGGCIASEGIEGIAANESTLVAQVGGELFISTDNAESWTQP